MALETSLDVSIAAAWVDSADHLGRSQWQTPDTGHPPPIPPTKTSGKQREAEQDLLEKDKLINMSTTIQKLLGFMLLFRCVMFAEYTIKTNCNWIIDSYRLWIRTLAFFVKFMRFIYYAWLLCFQQDRTPPNSANQHYKTLTSWKLTCTKPHLAEVAGTFFVGNPWDRDGWFPFNWSRSNTLSGLDRTHAPSSSLWVNQHS